jgi:hypothetical protein
VTAAAGPVSCDGGASILAEISTKGLAGLKVTVTSDVVQDLFPLPSDVDTDRPVYFRVYWLSDTAATTKTFVPLLLYGQLSDGSAIAAPTTALDTIIASDTSLGANKLAVTSWGIINENKLTGGRMMNVQFKMNGTCVTKTVWVIGYEMEYTPWTCQLETDRLGYEPPRYLDY